MGGPGIGSKGQIERVSIPSTPIEMGGAHLDPRPAWFLHGKVPYVRCRCGELIVVDTHHTHRVTAEGLVVPFIVCGSCRWTVEAVLAGWKTVE